MENNDINVNTGSTPIILPIPATTSSDVVQEAIDKLVSQLNEINKPQTEN